VKSSRSAVPALAAVVPGVLLLALVMRFTPHMRWDSVEYLSAAWSFLTHGTLTTALATSTDTQVDATGRLITSHPFVLWPPGYPVLTAAIARLFGTSLAASAALINIASLTIVLWCAYSIALAAVSEATAAVAIACVGVLPVVQQTFRSALSEPLFLACCALMLLSVVRMWTAQAHRGAWALSAAVAAGLATNVRFTGVFAVIFECAAAAGLLAFASRTARQRALVVISIVLGPAVASMFIVHRWYTLGCTLCERRLPSTQSLLDILRASASGAFEYVPALRDVVPGPLDTVLSIGTMALVLLLFRSKRVTVTGPVRSALLPIAIFSTVYFAGMVAIRTRVEFDALDARLLAPAFLPLAMCTAVAVAAAIGSRSRLAIGTILVAVLSAAQLASSREPWRGLSDPLLRHSVIVADAELAMDSHPGLPVLSSDAALLTAQIGFDKPIYWMPKSARLTLRPGERLLVVLRPDAEGEELSGLLAPGTTAVPFSAEGGAGAWLVSASF
jgi:4-amino-4-deoxy-L-arabinose transferase-like glycosyltransferase